jgi:hypothetical protein
MTLHDARDTKDSLAHERLRNGRGLRPCPATNSSLRERRGTAGSTSMRAPANPFTQALRLRALRTSRAPLGAIFFAATCSPSKFE